MNATAFFSRNHLPVFDHLSMDSKRRLNAWFDEGNGDFRRKKLLEFFKTVDWLSADEVVDTRPLQKLSPVLQRQLLREIEDYRMHRAAMRAENADKREQYKLRIFEYFRAKMPPADKALLESLRDFELDLTGRDVNWRHYFTLDSFKKIDAFIQAGREEREQLFASFRRDVETYKRNYDKLHQEARSGGSCEHGFSFDDWCDMMGDAAPRGGNRYSHGGQGNTGLHTANPVITAYQTLDLKPNTPPEAVKKQFRRLTLTHHPDLASPGQARTQAEERMKAIVAAYQEIQRYWAASTCV